MPKLVKAIRSTSREQEELSEGNEGTRQIWVYFSTYCNVRPMLIVPPSTSLVRPHTMSSKHAGDLMQSLMAKKARLDEETASARPSTASNPHLRQPVHPEQALQIFLTQARASARKYQPPPYTQPFCEIEIRLGVLHVGPRRVANQGTPHLCGPNVKMESGVSKIDFEDLAIGQALGVQNVKEQVVEKELVETVYVGYPGEKRVSYQEGHSLGCFEYKERLQNMDLSIPASPYDVRLSLTSEKIVDRNVAKPPPPGWRQTRVKRRKSYTRKDHSMAWQIDVTQVTVGTEISHEVEVELDPKMLLQLVKEEDEEKAAAMAKSFAKQCWWILNNLNPMDDVRSVDDYLEAHPDAHAVRLARATCGALRKFMEGHGERGYASPLTSDSLDQRLLKYKFPGCMPVNFSRHNLDQIQNSPDNAYYVSEKTDGVRYLMVFTGDTVVLVDRAMEGRRLKAKDEPMASVLKLIQPGTVLDGEVVLNRKLNRPIFIVFDVLAINATTPVLQLPFEERLNHLRKSSFRTSEKDVFDNVDPSVALPLVRKKFCKRTDIDDLLNKVVEEKGLRSYRNGDLHYHLTDGIIFQPNKAYVCGTDHSLLKWKYLDTVTMDVQILPLRPNDDDDVLRVACLGDDGGLVEISTRHMAMPMSERLRMEADRATTGGSIAEIGFHPQVGSWYYSLIRSDKTEPNHISTIMGTLLELAENLTTEELRYRMSVPANARDNFRRDVKGMMTQVLHHQRQRVKATRAQKK